MDTLDTAVRDLLTRSAREHDAGLCLTIEVEGHPRVWVQITCDSLSFALPDAPQPDGWLGSHGVVLPRGAKLLAFERGSFATYAHDARDQPGVVRFARQYLQALGFAQLPAMVRMRMDNLGPPARGLAMSPTPQVRREPTLPELPEGTPLPIPNAPLARKTWKKTAFWGLVIFAFCLAGALNEGLDTASELRLARSGRRTDATVTDATIRTAYYVVPVHTLRYAFSVGQRTYSFNGTALRHYYRAIGRQDRPGDYSVDVPLSTWQAAVDTGNIPVVYLPDDPWVNRPVAQDEGMSALTEHALGTTVFLALALVGAFGFLRL